MSGGILVVGRHWSGDSEHHFHHVCASAASEHLPPLKRAPRISLLRDMSSWDSGTTWPCTEEVALTYPGLALALSDWEADCAASTCTPKWWVSAFEGVECNEFTDWWFNDSTLFWPPIMQWNGLCYMKFSSFHRNSNKELHDIRFEFTPGKGELVGNPTVWRGSFMCCCVSVHSAFLKGLLSLGLEHCCCKTHGYG